MGADNKSPIHDKVMQALQQLKPGNAIAVKIGTAKNEYNLGDPFEVRFMADKSCYIFLMDISTNGDISFLAPSAIVPETKIYIEGQKVYSTLNDFGLPSIKIGPPGGNEIVNIFCSTEKDLFGADAGEKLFAKTIKPTDTEELTLLLERLEQLKTKDWSGNSVPFKILSSPLSGATRGMTSFSGALPPIDSTGTSGRTLFPPIDSTGTSGKTNP